MNDLGERVKATETRLDSCHRRLDAHGRELEEMRIKNARQDAQLEKLCQNQQRTYELTEKNAHKLDKMSAQGDTVAWMVKAIVYGVPAMFTLYLTLKQMGWY